LAIQPIIFSIGFSENRHPLFGPMLQKTACKLYPAGHLMWLSALPVLTDQMSAPLRFSKSAPYVSAGRVFKRSLWTAGMPVVERLDGHICAVFQFRHISV
jgi:hypothetical protein